MVLCSHRVDEQGSVDGRDENFERGKQRSSGKILDRQGPHSRWHTVEGPFNCFPICKTAYQKHDGFEDFQRQAPGEKRCEQQYEDAWFDRKPDCQRVHMLGQHCGLVQLRRKSKRDRWLQQYGRAKQGVDGKDEAVENAKKNSFTKKGLGIILFRAIACDIRLTHMVFSGVYAYDSKKT